MNTFAIKRKHTSSVTKKARPNRFVPQAFPVQKQQSQIRHILQSTGAQTKLTIGQPNDKYEQEADRVADQVMRMSDADVAQRVEAGTVQPMRIQRLCPECEEEMAQRQPMEEEEEMLQPKLNGELLQRQPMEEEEEALQAKEMPGQTPTVAPNLESRINSLKGGGQPLDSATRSFFEPRFGHDFSNVRVHTDSSSADTAKSINARAFTLRNHVVMGAGEYQPKSESGQSLLGHELTHVVQQKKALTPFVNNRVQRQRARLSDPEVITATALNAMVRLRFNMTWTREEAVSFLWPNGRNPPSNFFMPDEADPWKTESGEYQRFLIYPSSFVLQGIRRDVHRMIYESLPQLEGGVDIPSFVPEDVQRHIREELEEQSNESNVIISGAWPSSDEARGLYWVRRTGRTTRLQVAILPNPEDRTDRCQREATETTNRDVTHFVVIERLSITEARARVLRIHSQLLRMLLAGYAQAFIIYGRGNPVVGGMLPHEMVDTSAE